MHVYVSMQAATLQLVGQHASYANMAYRFYYTVQIYIILPLTSGFQELTIS